jgi:hypothetical protein
MKNAVFRNATVVRSDVLEERTASIFRVEGICHLAVLEIISLYLYHIVVVLKPLMLVVMFCGLRQMEAAGVSEK